MTLTDAMDSRLVHVALLSVLAVGVVALFPEAPNERVLVAAAAPAFTWYLGILYERALIVNAGLADEEDVKSLERENAKFLLRDRD